MKRILLASALALGTMTSFALAENAILTDTQMDNITAGQMNGFARDSGQGTLNNDNVQDNNGTTEVSGPRGQIINQDNTDCNNCRTNLPGANR
jgi:hypothetical protein